MEKNLDRAKIRIYDNSTKQLTYYDIGSFVLTDETSTEYFKENCIMQFSTGLKDKNGKLIYEGDILQFTIPNTKATVYFHDFISSMKLQAIDNCGMPRGEGGHLTRNLVSSATVLGNRFKNPELLENV